ncbi:site-2 protease family protein [Variovorax sp. LARHSF232]
MTMPAQASGPAQNAAAFDAQALPPLRKDLRLIDGGAAGRSHDAVAQWKIHDPLAQRFFEVDRGVVEMLAQWPAGTVGAMRDAVARATGRRPAEQDVKALIEFLMAHELVRAMPQHSYAQARQRAARQNTAWSQRLLHGYLFFKVPLARPDAFLRRTLPCVSFCFKPAFWVFLAALGLFSLYLVSRQWERFLSTFPDMFSIAGMATFGLSLALIKTLHELGHGYTAVRMGSRVTTMGVAFIVMTPVLYTDTTDAWRLPDRRQRVLIDAAGMAVEIMVAVLASLAWVFLPDGALRHAAFALATTGWVLSVLVNINPLMRFDGYYLFSDLMGYPNLQERSFAMGRWYLRELLFGYGDGQPEPAHGRGKWFLVGFAYATWVYRVLLFLGIALLVYHLFFKLLGVALFAVEIAWFIVLPIWRELRVWLARRRESGARVRITAVVALALLGALLVPMPYTVRIPAVLSAAEQAPVFASQPARLEEVHVHPGQAVRAGQVLLTLTAPLIDQQLLASHDRAALLEERLGRRSADDRDLSESLVLARELRLERDRIEGLLREKARLVVRAPLDGVVAELAQDLHAGRWLNDKTRLAVVAATGALEARGCGWRRPAAHRGRRHRPLRRRTAPAAGPRRHGATHRRRRVGPPGQLARRVGVWRARGLTHARPQGACRARDVRSVGACGRTRRPGLAADRNPRRTPGARCAAEPGDANDPSRGIGAGARGSGMTRSAFRTDPYPDLRLVRRARMQAGAADRCAAIVL